MYFSGDTYTHLSKYSLIVFKPWANDHPLISSKFSGHCHNLFAPYLSNFNPISSFQTQPEDVLEQL